MIKNGEFSEKLCSNCKIIKSLREFPKSKYQIDGYGLYCKICNRIKINENERIRMQNDILYRVFRKIKSTIFGAIKNGGYTKKSRTYEILGCSYEDFMIYIESQFESWMEWSNHGVYTGNYNETWQYDHIIPISSAMSEEEILKLNHYTNFQPLCSKQNSDKRAKLDYTNLSF